MNQIKLSYMAVHIYEKYYEHRNFMSSFNAKRTSINRLGQKNRIKLLQMSFLDVKINTKITLLQGVKRSCCTNINTYFTSSIRDAIRTSSFYKDKKVPNKKKPN